jgi:hypothetical protein
MLSPWLPSDLGALLPACLGMTRAPMPPPRITSSVASHLSASQQQLLSQAVKEQDKDPLALPRTL